MSLEMFVPPLRRRALLLSALLLVGGCADRKAPVAAAVATPTYDAKAETAAPQPSASVESPKPLSPASPAVRTGDAKVVQPRLASAETPVSAEEAAFARIEKAHAAWTLGGATIDVTNTTSQGTVRARFRLDLDGKGGATLRLQVPAQGKGEPTDQTYRLSGTTLIGVDALARETLNRPAPTQGPLGLRMAAALGGMDDAVAFLVDDAGRERYLKPFRELGGWKSTGNSLVRRTTGDKASLTRLDLDPSGRLRAMHVELPGSRLDWKFAYGPVQPFVAPKGYAKVDNFIARARPPKYVDEKAKTVTERMLRSVARLQNAIVRLDGTATFWIGGSRVRYENGGAGFAFDGRALTLKTPGAAYQGKSRRSEVIEHTAALLGDVDPLVRSILVRTPPYADVFAPEAKVRVVGTMASAGQSCDVVAVDGPRYRASLFVRKSDGLPLSIETEALGGDGQVVSRSNRTLAWSSVGTPLPKALFALRIDSGQTVLPLPELPKPKL